MDGSHQIRPLVACALSVPPARRKSPPGRNKQNHLTIGPPRISAGLHAVISGASPLWLPGDHGNTSPYVYASPPSAANVRSCREESGHRALLMLRPRTFARLKQRCHGFTERAIGSYISPGHDTASFAQGVLNVRGGTRPPLVGVDYD